MGRRALVAGLLAALLLPLALPAQARSARVVEGRDGYLFIAQDWTVACQDRGRARATATVARDLAAALVGSGRPTVVALGPDKSSPLARLVPPTAPRKACGDASRAAVWRELTTTARPHFLDVRPALVRADRSVQTYWRKDTHWTPTGGVVYARELARRFDPQLAARLRTRPATYRHDGDLARVNGQPDDETVRGLALVNPGVDYVELPYTYVGTDHWARRTRAVVQPGGRVLPGRTVLIGDSFNAAALEQLALLFEETVFLYPGAPGSPLDPVMAQVEQADRVVVEVVERFAQRYRMFQPDVPAAARRVAPRRVLLPR